MALIFILNLTAFFAEVAVLPITQCNVVSVQKMDKCGVCKIKSGKDKCKSSNKKTGDHCSKNAFCFNCPLCSVFVSGNFNQSQIMQSVHKKTYRLYADDLISAYIPDTWKPPNVS